MFHKIIVAAVVIIIYIAPSAKKPKMWSHGQAKPGRDAMQIALELRIMICLGVTRSS